MNLQVLGIILTVTGIVALIVSATRGPNLGISKRTGIISGVVLLVIGAGLLVYSAAT